MEYSLSYGSLVSAPRPHIHQYQVRITDYARQNVVQVVGDTTGQLVRIGATKALLESSEGQISVPNVILLEEVVRLSVDNNAASSDQVRLADDQQETEDK